ncbi:MAG: polyribonucleotide nucleotidyltransferase [Chlamydiales bacterium]|nr:polyribonucleotide nucleotidyltransferase [Chlamydiales bacterium]
MNLDKKSTSVTIDGKTITFETGKIARQAGGAVLATQGETMVLSTACSAAEPTEKADFVPLRVDYQEKFSAAGKTLGGFIKREGRPTERETLVSRLIDRPIRPLFPEGFSYEVQLLSYVFSFDGVHSPDYLAICATSAALMISDIPFTKPIGAVRMGFVEGKFIVNPTIEELNKSKLDLVLAGTSDAILMIEGHCDFLTEEQVLESIETGHRAIQQICKVLVEWQAIVGKPKSQKPLFLTPQEVIDAVDEIAAPLLEKSLCITDKQAREDASASVKATVLAALFPEGKEPKYLACDVSAAFKKIESKHMRKMILSKNIRCDGRKTTEIRPIDVEQGLLPRAHGSSLFTRGETQALAVCTLGGEGMGLRYEDLNGDWTSKFYLQYSFPPFSVGEVGRIGAPGRREVGHGKLAERSLKALIPSPEKFPYTVRLESNITESNGSSSMASVCGGCLALMDAGVPVERPISGIAMGLILESNHYVILSDILGIEDALGDMDFKVAGDERGITAFQMDIKVEGITHDIMKAALAQARDGRIHILKKMLDACPNIKTEMSKHAPRIETIQVKQSKLGTIIGPGGKMIRSIIEETGVQIDINDSGLVSIASNNADGMKKAKQIILDLISEIEVGKTYQGRVTSVMPFGAFVEVLPGKEGLCHISELDNSRIVNIHEFVKEGDEIVVKVLEVDDKGRYKLSRKAAL